MNGTWDGFMMELQQDEVDVATIFAFSYLRSQVIYRKVTLVPFLSRERSTYLGKATQLMQHRHLDPTDVLVSEWIILQGISSVNFTKVQREGEK